MGGWDIEGSEGEGREEVGRWDPTGNWEAGEIEGEEAGEEEDRS